MKRVTVLLALLCSACVATPTYVRAPENEASQEAFERDVADCQAKMIGLFPEGPILSELAYRRECMRARGWVQTN